MPATNTLIVVEGPHDVEVVARLLKPKGFHRIRQIEELPNAWHKLVPRSFPVRGDLLARHPAPLFLHDDSRHVIALRSAMGIDAIASALHDSLNQLEFRPEAIAALLDADDRDPVVLHGQLSQALKHLGVDPPLFPSQPGIVEPKGDGRTGVFVAPNNSSSGTIEHLLLEGAEANYPDLLGHARIYVTGLPKAGLTGDDLKEFLKPSGAQKATVHAMTAILKPGKSAQTSIQDNRWLDGIALRKPLVAGLDRFLEMLLG